MSSISIDTERVTGCVVSDVRFLAALALGAHEVGRTLVTRQPREAMVTCTRWGAGSRHQEAVTWEGLR